MSKSENQTENKLLRIGPLKAHAWSKAPETQYFEHLHDLAKIYAGKQYRKTHEYDILKDETRLFRDYKKWLEERTTK